MIFVFVSSLIKEFKQRRFWAMHVNQKWTFCILSREFKQLFEQINSTRVKTLSNTNLVASRQFKIEKGSLPVDVRRWKTSLLKLPISFFHRRNLIPESNVCEATQISFFWAPNGLDELPEMRNAFRPSLHLDWQINSGIFNSPIVARTRILVHR